MSGLAAALMARAWPPVARLRAHVLVDLWTHRKSWRLPLPYRLMQRERDGTLSELMPAAMVISLMVGFMLLVTLPSTLGDAYASALTILWPAWAIQAAPLVAGQLLAMQRAPALALDLSRRHGAGELAALLHLQSSPAAYPCVSWIAAHAVAAVATSFLLIAASLIFGFTAAFTLAVGDLRQAADIVFSLVSPLDWLRSLITAGVLGIAASLACVLYAWPGTRSAVAGLDAHRLGLRAMMASSATVLATAVALHWFFGLLAFLKWW